MGTLFLDPHGDAIEDLLERIPAHRQNDVIVLDPSDDLYTFGINLLECPDPENMTEHTWTFAQAIDLFRKLFANPQTQELDVLLNQYLRNSFLTLIPNQGYTLLEIPLLLEEKPLRDHLLKHPLIAKDYRQVVDFWQQTFDPMPPKDRREEIASTKRRLDAFGDFKQIKAISQKEFPYSGCSTGLIKMSYLGNAGCRVNRASTACIAVFPSEMPFW